MSIDFFPIKYIAVLLALGLFLPVCCLQSQLSIQFIPAINGGTVNGLFTAQVQNTTAHVYTGKIKIAVRDAGGKIVLFALTPSVLLRPGANPILALAPQAKIQFGNSALANIVAQTGRFPENDYEYCFELTGIPNKPAAAEQVFENCYNYSTRPFIPLSLVYPADGDELCNTRPGFNWQPAMPLVSSYRYRVVVTEKKDKQAAADALLNNIPVLQQENIAGFILPYPPLSPGLQKEKDYVWQVMVFEGNTRITQSEIGAFSIHCIGEKPDTAKESYRQLSGSLNGNYYLVIGSVHFSVINPYGFTNMQYSITDIADPAAKISNLPPVKLPTGLSKIDIPLEGVYGMQLNRMYLLKINNIGDHALYLQFIYKGDEIQE